MSERPTVPADPEALEAAADYIDAHGWCQGDLAADGRVCLLGALDAVGRRGHSPFVGTNIGAVADYLREQGMIAELLDGKVYVGQVIGWNDQPDRTAEDVTAVLRKTAIALREKVTDGS